MANILHIETSTKSCSVAIANKGEIASLIEESDQNYSHAKKLTVFINEAIKKAKIDFHQLDAICVSKGPGSYTGLRIGVSTAKGICYALDIPLIAIDSLYSLAGFCHEKHSSFISEKADDKGFYLCPMIDARRMEVYSAVYDEHLNEIMPVNAVIIDESSFRELIDEKAFFIFGDGASKCKDVLNHPNLHIIPEVESSATGLIKRAYQLFTAKQFENTAYFEPFYLKDFVAGKPKVKGLYD